MIVSSESIIEQFLRKKEAQAEILSNLARQYLGVQSLYSHQIEGVIRLFEHRKALMILPTGSGKSLLYILPSLLCQSVTIVVSPLIALMMDQVKKLEQLGIGAGFLSHEQNRKEKLKIKQYLANQKLRILFVSPERFCTTSFVKFIKPYKPFLITIDEAHCVSSWGDLFRTDYQKLRVYLNEIDPNLALALTATASLETREDIIRTIFHDTVYEYVEKPVPQNLEIHVHRVRRVKDKEGVILDLLRRQRGQKSIIYFNNREDCEKWAHKLRHLNFKAYSFHSKIVKEEKDRILSEAVKNESCVICATLALSLGVDLPKIDLVVVNGFPRNLEELIQMWGRSGRAGEKGIGVMVWDGSDPVKRFYQMEKEFPDLEVILNQKQYYAHWLEDTQSQFYLRSSDVPYHPEFWSFLRVVGIISPLKPYLRYWSIKSWNWDKYRAYRGGLPKETVTQRQKMCEFLEEELRRSRGDCWCFSDEHIQLETQLSLEQQKNVFDNLMEWGVTKVIYYEKYEEAYQWHGMGKNFEEHVELYLKKREKVFERLRSLKSFAEQEGCRLLYLEKYFCGTQGMTKCGYCDRCATTVEIEKEKWSSCGLR